MILCRVGFRLPSEMQKNTSCKHFPVVCLSPYSCWWCLKNLSDLSAGHSFFCFSFGLIFYTSYCPSRSVSLFYPSLCSHSVTQIWMMFSDLFLFFYIFCCQSSVNEMCSGFNYSEHLLLCHHLCVGSWKWLISGLLWTSEMKQFRPTSFFLTNKIV